MKQGWEIKKLSQLFDVKSSRRVHQADWKSSGIPFYRAREVVKLAKDGMVENELFISQELYDEFTKEKGAPKTGDIIVSAVGTLGQCYLVKDSDKFYFKDASVLWFDNIGKVNSQYIEYAFQADSIMAQVMEGSMGATVGTLTISRAKEIEIPLPPLPEQQRIVCILDEAFSAIERSRNNAEQNLKNAKELFESYLQGVFENKGDGWEEKTLKEISIEFARGKSKHRPRGDESLLGGEYPLIQTGDISNAEHWIYEFSQTYNEKGLAQSKLWPKGTICIAIVGANVGETAIINFDACFPDSVIGIVVNPKKANCEYVDYLLQTFKAYLKEKGKGTARDNINLGTFENQKFPFPSIEQQQTIVRQLDALRAETQKLEAMYRNKIADLEELKKSILQKALVGS